MYTLLRESLGHAQGGGRTARRRLAWPVVSPVVLALGFTSLFTDISSEMVSSILPLYLVVQLGLSPLSFGVLDGLYQGSSALVRLGSGVVADRWRRHRDVAAAGYGISAVAKIGLLLAGGAWAALTAVILIERTGKGIRTAPRDALISLNTPPESLGTAFGVHRALDTLGALLGPVVAFAVLTAIPGGFDVIFMLSFCVALVGLGVILFFVRDRSTRRAEPEPALTLRAAARLLATPRFGMLVAIGSLLSLVTISDSFLYLVLQRRMELSFGLFPLLYVGTALVYFVLAVPAGWLADRIGRGRVFTGGYLLLIAVYVALLGAGSGTPAVAGYLVLFGAYYAATDGVLTAQASALLPTAVRASGLALLATAISLARLGGSILFGALWSWRGDDQAIVVLLAGLIAATALALFTLARVDGAGGREGSEVHA